MVDPKKETKDDRTRRTSDAYDSTRTGEDPSFVAVNTLPTEERTTATGTRATETERRDEKPLTEKVGETLHEAKEDVKAAITPGKTETERQRMEDERKRAAVGTATATKKAMARPDVETTATGTTKDVDWEGIQHPGMEPCDEDPYGTRPVSELTKPTKVTDKADLAAVRMMDRDKQERDRLERQRIAATGITTAAATRAATTRTETTTTKEAMRTEPMAGERTTRQGAAIGTEPTGTTTTTPPKPSTTVDERSRVHAEDTSMHPDWETQPQVNAPQDVGVPTPEGQADAARLQAGERRSDVSKEPRVDRRGGDYDVPVASGARRDVKDDRSMTQKMKDEAYKAKETTKEKAREVKEDVDRTI